MSDACVVCETEIDGSTYPIGWWRFTFVTDESDVDDWFICDVCRSAVIKAVPATEGEAPRT